MDFYQHTWRCNLENRAHTESLKEAYEEWQGLTLNGIFVTTRKEVNERSNHTQESSASANKVCFGETSLGLKIVGQSFDTPNSMEWSGPGEVYCCSAAQYCHF